MSSIDPRLKRLADRIGSLIDASSYLPADVARELEVDKSSVSRWIKGTRTPTMQNLIDLATLLGVEVTDFWEGEQAYPSTPEQRMMLEKMAGMSPEQQQALLAFVAATANKGE